MTISKDSFFSATKLNAEQKAASTHREAMRIVEAEATAREKKTVRLKEMRELHQASQPPEPEKPSPTRAKRK
jgi:hypothetical protein